MTAVSRALAAVANRRIAADPEMGQVLARGAGKVLAVRLGAGARVALRILADGRLEAVHAAVDADCEAALAGLDPDGRPKWKVSGDADLLGALSERKGAGPFPGAEGAARLLGAAVVRAGAELGDIAARLGEAAERHARDQGRVVTRDRLVERRREISRLAARIDEAAAALSRARGEQHGRRGQP